MTHPTIHTNGTSRDALLDDACTVVNAIVLAIDAACSRGPNARDYYPQGDGAFEKARAEHDSRIARLVEVRKEYEAIAEAIAG